MKRVLVVFAMLLLVATAVWAGSATIMSSTNATPYTQPFTDSQTIASSVTTTPAGSSTVVTTLGVPMSNFSCNVVYSTTTPSTATSSLEGSIDGTYWRVLSSVTTTLSTGNMFESTGKLATRVRMANSVVTKATGTTIINYKCIGWQ